MSRAITLLLAGSLLLAILAVQPASPGSATAPEITDGATADQKMFGPDGTEIPLPLDTLGIGKVADLRAAWVSNETSKSITVSIQVNTDIQHALVSDTEVSTAGTASYEYTFKAQAGIRPVLAGAKVKGAGSTDPTSPANTLTGSAQNLTISGNVLSFQIPRTALDNATAGTKLTNLTLSVKGLIFDANGVPLSITDTAPDSGFGLDYTFTMDTAGRETTPGTGGGSGNPNGAPGCTYRATETNRSDADADCLPDAWEKQYFPAITSQNGAGDPDGDGCNNRCEYLHGTDPTKKDSDGDGASDGDEVTAGTDPTNPASKPSSGTGTTTSTTTNTSTSTNTSTGTKTSTNTGTSTGVPPATSTSQSPLEKIQADAGYAVASGAAMGTIVLLSLIGLFGRWGA